MASIDASDGISSAAGPLRWSGDPGAYAQLLESVLDALSDSIEVTAADGSVVFRNRVARQFRDAPATSTSPSDFIVSLDVRIPVPTGVQAVAGTDSSGAAAAVATPSTSSPPTARLRVRSSIAAAHNPVVQRVLDSFPQLVWQNPTDAAADFVNAYWCDFTGIQLKSFDTTAWTSTVHPDDNETSLVAWAEAQATGTPYRCAYRVRRHDGDWRWFLACAMPIAGTRRWLGTAADITDQKRLQQELEDERALMLTTIDQLPVSVIIGEANTGRLRLSNQRTFDVWRHHMHPSANIEEYDAWVGYHPDGRRYEGKDWPLARSIATGEVVNGEDTPYERGDGTRGIVRLWSSPVRNARGDIIAGVVVCDDVTDRKRAEEEETRRLAAEKTAEATNSLMSMVSHELRTPLNGLLGMANLLALTPLTDEQAEYVSAVSESGKLLLTVINDVLCHSKITAGKLHLEHIAFDLRAVVTHVVNLMAEIAREKGVGLLLDLPPSLPVAVKGDPQRLKQIMMNLLSNALRFTERGGTVQVKASLLSIRQHLPVPSAPSAQQHPHLTTSKSFHGRTDAPTAGLPLPAAAASTVLRSLSAPTVASPVSGAVATSPAAGTDRSHRMVGPSGGSVRPVPSASLGGDSAALRMPTPLRHASMLPIDADADEARSVDGSSVSLASHAADGVGSTTDMCTVDGGSPPCSPVSMATLRFEVYDNGIGIDAETLKRLWRPFTQANSSTTRTHGGTGLGLSIVSQLVSLMGGEVGVDSEAGRGSCFRFIVRLPLATMHEVLAEDPLTPKPGSGASTPISRLAFNTGGALPRPSAFPASAPIGPARHGDDALPLRRAPHGSLPPLTHVPPATHAVGIRSPRSGHLASSPLAATPRPIMRTELSPDKQPRSAIIPLQPLPVASPGMPHAGARREPGVSTAVNHGSGAAAALVTSPHGGSQHPRPGSSFSLQASAAAAARGVLATVQQALGPLKPTARGGNASAVMRSALADVPAPASQQSSTYSPDGKLLPRSALPLDLPLTAATHHSSALPSTITGTSGASSSVSVAAAAIQHPRAIPATASVGSVPGRGVLGATSPRGSSPAPSTAGHAPSIAAVALTAYSMGEPSATAKPLAPLLSSPGFAAPRSPALMASTGTHSTCTSSATTGSDVADSGAADLASVRILVAEDNPVNSLLVSRLLQKLGYTNVTMVTNGADAVTAVESGEFTILLMDVNMPILDGLDATRAIRALPDPRKAAVPVIALTASALQADIDRCRAAMMNDHLAKPYNVKSLHQMLALWTSSNPGAAPPYGFAGGQPAAAPAAAAAGAAAAATA